MPFLRWLEQSAPSIWLRESESWFALPGMLLLHTIGMGLLAGTCLVIGLRVLGSAASLPLAPFAGFRPLIRGSFWLNFFSGMALLLAYPTKALTNPLFYAKLGMVVIAVIAWRRASRSLFTTQPALITPRLKRIVLLSLCCWFVAILCGRLLAYTYQHLLADSP